MSFSSGRRRDLLTKFKSKLQSSIQRANKPKSFPTTGPDASLSRKWRNSGLVAADPSMLMRTSTKLASLTICFRRDLESNIKKTYSKQCSPGRNCIRRTKKSSITWKSKNERMRKRKRRSAPSYNRRKRRNESRPKETKTVISNLLLPPLNRHPQSCMRSASKL